MTAVAMSLFAGAGAQFFTVTGSPLTGGLIYTYLAGTTTPQTTYTTSSGNVAHANPIVLDSSGRVNEIWLATNINYKFVLKDSNGVLIATYDNVPGSTSSADLANTTNPALGDALIGFRQSNASGNAAGAVGRTVHQKLQEFVSVADFGAVGDGTTDDSDAIQAAINYAQSLVVPQNYGNPVGGCTVMFNGVYKITKPIRVSQSNIRLQGQGGTTITPYFTSKTIDGQTYNGAPPVFFIGTGLDWYTNGLSSATFGNSIDGFYIKQPSGGGTVGCIAVLFSGTRNASATNMMVEIAYMGLYIENTSEFYCQQYQTIGCTYGFICDSRVNRAAADTVLNHSSSTNDVSSSVFSMLTAYYAQSTGFLAMACGTLQVNGMTVGQFSGNQDTSGNLGLPTGHAAGVMLLGQAGTNINFTRGMLFNDIVFEAIPNINSDCIYLNCNATDTPIIGVTFQNCVIQTYASDISGGTATRLLHSYTIGGGYTGNVVLRDCGFVAQTSGYYYGEMCKVEGNGYITFDNCYPDVAFSSTVNAGQFTRIRHQEVLERPDLSTFPPTGWGTTGTTSGCSGHAGALGVPSYLEFTGSTGAIEIYKDFTYVDYVPEMSSPFISFLCTGDGPVSCWARVNGEVTTDSNVFSTANVPRYSNAQYYGPTIVTTYPNTIPRRIVFCFTPFSANYGFQQVRFNIGIQASSSASKYVQISDLTVGYMKNSMQPYNPF